jgi:hypothetical protein
MVIKLLIFRWRRWCAWAPEMECPDQHQLGFYYSEGRVVKVSSRISSQILHNFLNLCIDTMNT